MIHLQSYITGHHQYKNVWRPELGEELTCRRYTGNPVDPMAIGVFRGNLLVGHVSRDIKETVLREIRLGRPVTATVTGRRENQRRRGLEVPATFISTN